MRLLAASSAAAIALALAGCSSSPPPSPNTAVPDWYPGTVAKLNETNRRAEAAFQSGKADDAAALIKEGLSLQARVLSVSRPTLEAAEAATDVDDLYGRMLLASRNYGWAQMFFQKNRSRWKNWAPQTPETQRRFKQAEAEIIECQKHID
jgi:tRNA A37 N6-isopentenylltransferase MiaA